MWSVQAGSTVCRHSYVLNSSSLLILIHVNDISMHSGLSSGRHWIIVQPQTLYTMMVEYLCLNSMEVQRLPFQIILVRTTCTHKHKECRATRECSGVRMFKTTHVSKHLSTLSEISNIIHNCSKASSWISLSSPIPI